MSISIKYFKWMFLGLVVFVCMSCKTASSDLNIVNGEFVNDKDYPTIIALEDGKGNFLCTGVIVSENVVLTAAHCLVDFEYEWESVKFKNDSEIRIRLSNGPATLGAKEVVYLDEFIKLKEKDEINSLTRLHTELDYLNHKISRSQYETTIKALPKVDVAPYDIGAVIFDDAYVTGEGPFRVRIRVAQNKGTYFDIAQTLYAEGGTLQKNKQDLFFLGFGVSGSYSDISKMFKKDAIEGRITKAGVKKQIGYNSVTLQNGVWSTPKPNGENIETGMYQGSNTLVGDSGGPLIYKGQIIGISSGFIGYDCEGNDVYHAPASDRYLSYNIDSDQCSKDRCCDNIAYSSSEYTSSIVKYNSGAMFSLVKKISERLSALKLVKDNEIFGKLSKTYNTTPSINSYRDCTYGNKCVEK